MNKQDEVDRVVEEVGSDLLARHGKRIGFCVMVVGEPFVVNGEVVDQPFSMSTNMALPGVLLLLSRALDNAAQVAKDNQESAADAPRLVTEMN